MDKQETKVQSERICPNCREQKRIIAERTKELTDLLKAIDCCSQDICSSCPYFVRDDDMTCMKHLFAMASDAITELVSKKN